MATPIKRPRDMTKDELQSECKKLKRKTSGNRRRSECGTYLASGEHRHVYWGYYTKGPRNGVKKLFKTGSVFEASAFQIDIATAGKTASIMTAFNAHNATYRYTDNEKFNGRKRLYLNMPEVWTCVSGDGKRSLCEPMIPGTYCKMTSNTGWVKYQTALTEALSHFSFHYTGGQCLVCDLQGAEDDTFYLLTDPAIHSIGQEFGPTDGGAVQMKSFFESHRCNKFCVDGWRRAVPKPSGNGMPVRMGTSFFFRR